MREAARAAALIPDAFTDIQPYLCRIKLSVLKIQNRLSYCVIHLFRDSVKFRYGRLSEVGRQPRFSDTLVSVFKLGLRHIYRI